MKHVFYGKVKELYAEEFNNTHLGYYHRKYMDDFYREHYKDRYLNPENYITRGSRYTEDIIIRESNSLEVLDEGDKVIVDSKEGTIAKRTYDVDTNTYTYYTNIIAKTNDRYADTFNDAVEFVKNHAKSTLDRLYPCWDIEEDEENLIVDLEKEDTVEAKEIIEPEPDNSTVFLIGSLTFFALVLAISVAIFI